MAAVIGILVFLLLACLVVVNKLGQERNALVEVVSWVDRRDGYYRDLYLAATAASTGVVHTDLEWGFEHGMPSKNAVNKAAELLTVARDRERAWALGAEETKNARKRLEEWEVRNPVPYGGDLTKIHEACKITSLTQLAELDQRPTDEEKRIRERQNEVLRRGYVFPSPLGGQR